MYSCVTGSTVIGIDGAVVNVEADVSDGLPMFIMVGYLSSSVKEAGERVRTALKNSGYHMPPKRVTINISPANIRKDGTGFDLPIAVAILLCLGITPSINMDRLMITGEMGLDGIIKPVPGILPMIYGGKQQGCDTCIVPYENVNEASLVKDMKVIGVKSLAQTINYIQGTEDIQPVFFDEDKFKNEAVYSGQSDFADVKGQEALKRGMEIAVSGFHNVLMRGAAGAGKSMIAKRLPTIMPSLTFGESVELTKIYSISGMTDNSNVLVTKRPFRSPHHTITTKGLIGGGLYPKPGEISLAHKGVLFLDELPEFNKNVIEVLRQPLEDRRVLISRVNASYVFPSDFMLVAAMNPCPCGYYPDRRCTCTEMMRKKYQAKISGPLMDRIDICIDVKAVEYENLFRDGKEERSEKIRERVERARAIQAKRYKTEGILFNSQLEGALVRKYISLGENEEALIKKHFMKLGMSARGLNRILKLSRTIADISGSTKIKQEHIIEALFYKNAGVQDMEVMAGD